MFRSWIPDDTGVIVQTCAYNTSSVTWNSGAGELTHNSAAISLWGSDTVTNLWDLFEFAELEGNYANVDRSVYAVSDEGARIEFRIWFNSSGLSSASFSCTAPDCTGFSQTIPVASSLYGTLVHDRLSIANIPCFNWRSINLFEDHFIPVNAFNPLLHFGGFVRNTQTTSASISQTQYYDAGGGQESEKLMIAISKIWFNGGGGGGSDPYEAGGYSDTTPSSSGDFDDDSDSISIPSLPSISAMGAGAVSLAVIDEANLGTFMNYILSPSFTGLSNISRFFSDPIKAIACLNYMPYTPTNTSGYTLSWGGDDTGASVGAVSAQYEEIDCGSVDLTEFYGSCLDYSPYTSVQLVLPFAGSVDIDPDEFNGKTISVKYHIDNYTGAGLVLVSDGDRVLLQVPCSVSNPIPLTSTDYSAVISAIANVVMGGVSTIAAVYTGGASVGASIALAGGFAASAAGNVMSAKLHYNHGGSMGMGTGMFGVLKPYLIIKRPRQCLPERNGKFQGYPTFVTENLGDLSGFTKIAEIHLDSIPVTTEERAELLAILKGGVIF